MFDTRFAAAESLQSYFSTVQSNCTSEDHLPALLALYDTLNDDDEEVRDVGSDAVKNILGVFMVPLEAATLLLSWLTQTFGNTLQFKQTVCNRMVGEVTKDWQPVNDQLTKALEFDDSLFAIEEQNLFIDEVRDTIRWLAVFESLSWSEDGELVVGLSAWIKGGLVRLKDLLKTDDGPLGWASNPQVFAILTRVVRGGISLSKIDSSVKDEVSGIAAQLQSQQSSASRLLVDPLVTIW